jgi:hypothetical protein
VNRLTSDRVSVSLYAILGVGAMFEGWSSPLHLLILFSSPFVFLGLPIYLVLVIVRKVKKKYPTPSDSPDA